MKRSAPNDAPKRTRRRTKSTPEKRQSAAKRVQQHRSNAAGTAQADIARENHRLAMQRFRASKENTPPPSQQEWTLSGEAMPAVRTVHRQPMTAVQAAVSGQHHAPPIAAVRTPASRQSYAPMPAALTDSSAMPRTAPRRTTARVVPPSTGNDTASVAQDPSATNPLGAVTRSRTRIATIETAQRRCLREAEPSPVRNATNARLWQQRNYRQTMPSSPESLAPTNVASPLRLPPQPPRPRIPPWRSLHQFRSHQCHLHQCCPHLCLPSRRNRCH
jgi:hypothetical protein